MIKLQTSSGITEIYFETDFLSGFKEYLKEKKFHKIFWIIDENVYRYHFKRINRKIKIDSSKIYFLKSGEKSKTFSVLKQILEKFILAELGRDSLVVAVGGGVTGDIAGLAASVYMRGIKIIHIPTTLLSMIDSSIGGKTGVNFSQRKNLIGTFHHPEAVFIDDLFLKTLPEEEMISGFGEIIKYSFLSDEKSRHIFTEFFQNRTDESQLKKVINLCASLKSSIVQIDETEKGVRKILNLGHTFGHAFEAATQFKISHGLAVNAGIITSLFLSYKKNFLDKAGLSEYLKIPLSLPLPRKILNSSFDEVNSFMRFDKKNRGGAINFVLVKKPGEIILDVPAKKSEVKFAFMNLVKMISGSGKTVEL